MGISMSGIGAVQKHGEIAITVEENHPLMLLARSLEWPSMASLVDQDHIRIPKRSEGSHNYVH